MTAVATRPRVMPWDATAPEVTRPGAYADMPDTVYHGDPTPSGSLSVSGAKKLLPPHCPALYHYQRENPPDPTDAFDLGHAAHQAVLGIGPEIVRVDADNWRTNKAKDERADARSRGAVPLLADDYAVVQDMAAALRKHPIATALFRDGEGTAEASLFWSDPATGVIRRSRLDWLPNPNGRRTIIADYKSARSADPTQFAKAAADYGYHQQHAWYVDGVTTLSLADDPAFVFVVQEKTPPYLVTVVELDVVAVRIGRHLNQRALTTYAECSRSGVWPGYAADVALVSLPAYYENRFAEDI